MFSQHGVIFDKAPGNTSVLRTEGIDHYMIMLAGKISNDIMCHIMIPDYHYFIVKHHFISVGISLLAMHRTSEQCKLT